MSLHVSAWQAAVAAITVASAGAPLDPLKVAGVLTGSDSAQQERALVLVNDAAAWPAIFQVTVETEPLVNPGGVPVRTQNLVQTPRVDFRNQMVVAYFGGPSLGVSGFRVDGVKNEGREATLRLVPTYLPAAITGSPYVFAVVNRTARRITVELDFAAPGARPDFRRIGILTLNPDRAQ
jgi:hypothetical protein